MGASATVDTASRTADTASKGLAPGPLDFAAWHSALETQFPCLSSSLGTGNAHGVLSVAHSVVDKFAAIRRPLPPHVEALLSVAISLSPVGDTDSLVARWRATIGWTGRRMAPFQARWITALPFASEVEQPALQQLVAGT